MWSFFALFSVCQLVINPEDMNSRKVQRSQNSGTQERVAGPRIRTTQDEDIVEIPIQSIINIAVDSQMKATDEKKTKSNKR